MGTKRIILGEGWSIMTMGVPDRNDTVDDQDLRYLEEQDAHQSEYSTSSVSLHLGQQADRGAIHTSIRLLEFGPCRWRTSCTALNARVR